MLRPALVLMLLLASVSHAATSAPPTGFPQLTLMTNGLKIESGGNGLTATRGGNTIWRLPGIVAFSLNSGPGRFITAGGFQLGPQTMEPNPRSLLIDPATGTLVASLSGDPVSVGPDAATYLDLQAPNVGGHAPLMTLTRLPLTTLRPEVRQIGANGLVPAVCQTARDSADAFSFGTRPLKSPDAAKGVLIRLENSRCDLTFKLTFATLKVELLDFKPTR